MRTRGQIASRLMQRAVGLHNRLLGNAFTVRYYAPELVRHCGGAHPSGLAIGEHIPTLYYEAVCARPRLIVELGTRGGESTRALLAAASQFGSPVLSIDVDPCGSLDLEPSLLASWAFEQDDDVAFGRNRFASWCEQRGLEAQADFIFLDSSHEYEHTKEELAVWVPHLAPRGTLVLHDTNMGEYYRRSDNRIAIGWDNERGVIRAVEELLETSYDETTSFVDLRAGWLIRHVPSSSGLTVMRRLAA